MVAYPEHPHIGIDLAGGILTLRLNRPEKKNALTRAMYATLAEALDLADRDPAVRVVLLTGGPDCFTAGNDLADFAAVSAAPDAPRSPNPFLPAVARLEKPLIAAVGGVAVGIGTTLLLHCDLVCAAPNSRFQLPFVNLGLCPEFASSLLLPRLAGHQRAAELLLWGVPFSADTAREIGLVNLVCAETELLATAQAKAAALAAQPAAAVRLTKSLLRRAGAGEIAARIAEENAEFGRRLASPEAAEALRAFAERRPPDFTPFS